MKTILTVAKSFLIDCVPPNGIVGDFTMGNGHDTLFLSQLVPQGKVYAFDIQPQALESTRKLLDENQAGDNVQLICACHSTLDDYIHEPIDGGMFNLGYLPWSDKTVTTKCETTLTAIEKAVALLKPGGALVVMIYPGHSEGAREGQRIEAYAKELDRKKFDATLYRIFNIPDCPYFVAIEKRK